MPFIGQVKPVYQRILTEDGGNWFL